MQEVRGTEGVFYTDEMLNIGNGNNSPLLVSKRSCLKVRGLPGIAKRHCKMALH